LFQNDKGWKLNVRMCGKYAKLSAAFPTISTTIFVFVPFVQHLFSCYVLACLGQQESKRDWTMHRFARSMIAALSLGTIALTAMPAAAQHGQGHGRPGGSSSGHGGPGGPGAQRPPSHGGNHAQRPPQPGRPGAGRPPQPGRPGNGRPPQYGRPGNHRPPPPRGNYRRPGPPVYGYDWNRPDPRYGGRYRPDRYYRGGYAPIRVDRSMRIYRGYDDRYYCRRSDGTTGLIIGGAIGALIGGQLDRGYSNTAGILIGGGAGALLGREIDRGSLSCR
jgi:hypothetical protein